MNMIVNKDFGNENLGNQKYELDTSNYINYMVEDFNKDLDVMLQCIEVLKQLPKDASKWEGVLNIQTSRLNSPEYVKKELKAIYWQKVFLRSNIQHFLSERDQKIWQESFSVANIRKDDYVELPEFDYSSIHCTVSSWYESSEQFFVDRVDSVFDTLSSGHLTNHPNGFNRKMIFKHWAEKKWFDEDKGKIVSWAHKKIHDLRSIILMVNGLPLPQLGSCYDLLGNLPFKTKIDFDHGLWTAQIFKNGNVHIWVDPETAVLLNWHLAKKYPNILSTKDMPIKNTGKDFTYATTGISSDLKNVLNAILHTGSVVFEVQKNVENEFFKYFGVSIPDFMQLDSNKMKSSIREILAKGLPCIKAYQFYPTPQNILDEIKDQIGELDSNQKLLEPSAGSGAIAQLYPDNFTCYEIYKPFVELLNAKGIQASNMDFLKQVGGYDYDKIIMNPPYSKKRCLMHFEHSFSFIHQEGEIYIVAPTGLKDKLEKIAAKFDRNLVELKKFDSSFEDTALKTSLFIAS